MDVNQLRTLIHVAELGSLSKAADRLNIAQPALSRQVRLLEQELGVALFERHGRGMVVTEVGTLIANHAAEIMKKMDDIRMAAVTGSDEYAGHVSVGVTPTIAEMVMVPLVSRIRTRHPKLALRFSSAFSGHLLDWLHRDELDVVLSYDPPPMRSLRILPVMVETLVLVEAAGEERPPAPLAFSALASMPLVLPSVRHGLRGILDRCATEAGVTLNPPIEADSFGAMLDLVRWGHGATVLPLASVFRHVQNGDFAVRRLVHPTPQRKLVVAFSSDKAISPAARMVGSVFVEIAKELTAKGEWSGEMLTPS